MSLSRSTYPLLESKKEQSEQWRQKEYLNNNKKGRKFSKFDKGNETVHRDTQQLQAGYAQ